MSADDVEFDVKFHPRTMMAAVIGTDDQGRTIILCPIHHDEAYVEADGRVVCPTQDAINAYVGDVLAKMLEADRG